MITKSIVGFITLTVLLLLPLCASAGAVNRDILAIYDSDEMTEEYDINIKQYAQMPLEHLGYRVYYADVSKRLPSDEEMRKYFAIVSWFTDNKIKGAPALTKWLTRQVKNGKKYILIGDFGFDFDEKMNMTPVELREEFYRTFNISFDPDESTSTPLLIEIVKNDPEMTEFERSLEGGLTVFEKLKALGGGAKVYLELKRKDTGSTGDMVFVHSKGGVIMHGYAYYMNPIDFQTRWRINPFKYFAVALGADFPKPDVSTINGMRLFYSHIDGDGIRNITYVDRKTSCGAMTYREMLTKYNLPITTSVVIGDIMEVSGKERERLIEEIRMIFLLPNVEPASHGWAHPYVWRKKGRQMGMKLRGYEYSPQDEIGNSIDYINKYLVPKGKDTDLFLWTGDCEPDYEALKYIYDHDIMNLNGGDTRFDNDYPSYTFVAPLFRHVEGLLQYLTANSNENIYTNGWTGPFYGYKYVVETFKRTESPIRIRPIDVYYHYYTMEHQVAIDALREAYDWSLSQDIAPVFASHYVETMTGFLTTRITSLGANRWLIEDNGKLRSIRFDDEKRGADLGRSKGVLGFNHYQGSLYVHLNNGKRSEIVLTGARPSRPYIVKANGEAKDWSTRGGKVEFKLRLMGRVQFVLGGMRSDAKYIVNVGGRDFEVTSDKEGQLSLSENMPSNEFWWNDISVRQG